MQRVGGHVAVESRAGQGTTVRFTLPFSVMMTRVMIVGVGSATFGIPLDAVVENLRVPGDRVVPIGASEAIVIRNQTVPVIDLADALGLQADAQLAPRDNAGGDSRGRLPWARCGSTGSGNPWK